MAAVLSLNGKPQVTLRVQGEQFVEEQHQLNDASSSPASSVTVGAATQQIMQVLGALTRIKISDGRIVVGRLHCFDKHQNVILTDAREFPPLFGPEKPKKKDGNSNVNSENALSQQDEDAAFEKHRSETTSRSLGMTLVPGKHIVYIKVQKTS